MQRRIWIILLACFLAWHFGPLLLGGLIASGPIAKELITIFTPINLTGRGIIFYLQFFVAVVIFSILIRTLGALFSFALPRSQRYGTTKLLRRIQGLCAEGLIILLFFFAIPLVAVLTINGWQETDAQAYVSVISESWSVYLAVAIVLYVLTERFIKRFLVSTYTSVLLGLIEPGRFGNGGSGRFAGLVEEWALRFDPWAKELSDALFMGRSLYSRSLHVGIDDDRHMLTIAGSRGGKGTTAIIPNLLLWKGSALVIDPKGTNAAVTAKRRQEMGQNVYVIDPFAVLNKEFYRKLDKPAGPDNFNPLTCLDVDSLTIREDIGVLADALVVADSSHKDPHWDDGARTVCSGLITHLVTSADFKEPSLPIIRELLALPPDQLDKLWAAMSLNGSAGGWARDAASRVVRGIGTEEIQNILSNVDKHTEWLGSEGIRKALTKFRESEPETKSIFTELKETPTTIYLVVPPRFLDIHRRFLRLFINLALNEMSKDQRPACKVLMMLDEFQQLGKMPEIIKAYRLLAGYNFILWIFAQDWAGMLELYGNDANTFLSSSRAVQTFCVSDAQSLGLISQQIGARSSSVMMAPNSPNITPLRTADEVAKETSRNSGKQYILRAGEAPLVLERVRYYEDSNSSIANTLDPHDRFWRSDLKSSWSAHPLEVLRRKITELRYPFRGLYERDPDY